MYFDKIQEVLATTYKQHGLDNPFLEKHRDIFRETRRTIIDLCNSLGRFSGRNGSAPNDKLKKELGELCYDYLGKSNFNNLITFSKKVEYLQLTLASLEKACILAEDPSGPAYISRMLIGIEKSLLHKETSCCCLFSLFYVGTEEQLCNDISNAVERFNRALKFNEAGLKPHAKLIDMENDSRVLGR